MTTEQPTDKQQETSPDMQKQVEGPMDWKRWHPDSVQSAASSTRAKTQTVLSPDWLEGLSEF